MDRRLFLAAAPRCAPLWLAAPLADARAWRNRAGRWRSSRLGRATIRALASAPSASPPHIEDSDRRAVGKVSYFAAGERVGAFDAFDAAASGDVQAYIGAEGYWRGKHPGFAFFPDRAAGADLHGNGGLGRSHGRSGVVGRSWRAGSGSRGCSAAAPASPWAAGSTPRSPSAADLQGLRFRVPGLASDVFSRLGVSPVSLPGRTDLREPRFRRDRRGGMGRPLGGLCAEAARGGALLLLLPRPARAGRNGVDGR